MLWSLVTWCCRLLGSSARRCLTRWCASLAVATGILIAFPVVAWAADTDGDGQDDTVDTDDDNDGVDDATEATNSTDPLDPRECGNSDADNCDDCINNPHSSGSPTPWVLYTPAPANDGTDTDGDEVCNDDDTDDDNDGVSDGTEATNSTDPLDPQECGNSDADLCDDCINNPHSVGSGTPWALYTPAPDNDGTDTDGDEVCNDDDIDDDNDGVSDATEATNSTDHLDPQE